MKSAPVIMAYMVAIVYATTVKDHNVHNTEVAELKAKVAELSDKLAELNNKLVDSNAKLAESNKYIRGTQLAVAASPPESQNELRAKVEALDMRTCPDRNFSNKNCKSWGNAASTLAGGNFPTGSASSVLEAASHELTYGLQMLQQHTLGESKQGCSVSQAVSTLESTEKTIKIKMKVPRVAISAVKERVTGWSLQNKKYCGPFPGDDACKSTSTSDKCFPGGDFNNCKAQCKGGCKGVSYDSNRNWCILCKSVTSLNTHSSWKTATKGGQGKEVWAPGRAIGQSCSKSADCNSGQCTPVSKKQKQCATCVEGSCGSAAGQRFSCRSADGKCVKDVMMCEPSRCTHGKKCRQVDDLISGPSKACLCPKGKGGPRCTVSCYRGDWRCQKGQGCQCDTCTARISTYHGKQDSRYYCATCPPGYLHARQGPLYIYGYCFKADPKVKGGIRVAFGAWPTHWGPHGDVFPEGLFSSHSAKADYRLWAAPSIWYKGGHFQPTCRYAKYVRCIGEKCLVQKRGTLVDLKYGSQGKRRFRGNINDPDFKKMAIWCKTGTLVL